MSEPRIHLKPALEMILLVGSVIALFFTVAKTAVLIPRDIEDLQKSDLVIAADVSRRDEDRKAEIKEVREKGQLNHDLLQRIDERTAQMMRDVQELKKRQ